MQFTAGRLREGQRTVFQLLTGRFCGFCPTRTICCCTDGDEMRLEESTSSTPH